MSNIPLLTNHFIHPSDVVSFTKNFAGQGNLIGKVIKSARHFRDEVIQNRITLIAIIILSTGFFNTVINFTAFSLINRDAILAEEQTKGNKTFKIFWLSGTLVGLSLTAFSYALSKTFRYSLNKPLLAVIAIAAFIFHNLFGRERDFIQYVKD